MVSFDTKKKSKKKLFHKQNKSDIIFEAEKGPI